MCRPRVLSTRESDEIARELAKVGVHPGGIEKLVPKGVVRLVKVRRLPGAAAHILKQTMLSIGGDVGVSYGSLTMQDTTTDAIILGTETHFRRLIENLKPQPLNLRELSEEIEKALARFNRRRFRVAAGEHLLEMGGRTLLMGIVNVTPDSFSDGGEFFGPDRAAERCLQLAEEGADIIDVGGESSRPGSEGVSAEQELRRVMPVLEKVSGKLDVPVSIDTVKPQVAREAVAAGVSIVNDISGLGNEEMIAAVAELGAAVVIMHIKGMPRTMQANPHYDDLMTEIIDFLSERMEAAVRGGVPEEKILVDPGIGFGKTADDNYRIIRRLEELRCLGRPIVVGPSRKSFIGKVVKGTPRERVFGTAAAVALCITNGAGVVRVHDLRQMKEVAAVADEFVALRTGMAEGHAGSEEPK